jgi:hypothetical protein
VDDPLPGTQIWRLIGQRRGVGGANFAAIERRIAADKRPKGLELVPNWFQNFLGAYAGAFVILWRKLSFF